MRFVARAWAGFLDAPPWLQVPLAAFVALAAVTFGFVLGVVIPIEGQEDRGPPAPLELPRASTTGPTVTSTTSTTSTTAPPTTTTITTTVVTATTRMVTTTVTVATTPATRSAVDDCSPAYPTVCIPPSPPDLDCPDIPFRRFTALPPDPHRFDGSDDDGIGCESG